MDEQKDTDLWVSVANAPELKNKNKNWKISQKFMKLLGYKNGIVLYSCGKFHEGLTSVLL